VAYDRPSERDSFFALADLLVETITPLFNARPHWGKYCPIDSAASEKLYPRLSEFRLIREQLDSQHVFGNAWIASGELFGRGTNLIGEVNLYWFSVSCENEVSV
jgi:hypothetical protein